MSLSSFVSVTVNSPATYTITVTPRQGQILIKNNDTQDEREYMFSFMQAGREIDTFHDESVKLIAEKATRCALNIIQSQLLVKAEFTLEGLRTEDLTQAPTQFEPLKEKMVRGEVEISNSNDDEPQQFAILQTPIEYLDNAKLILKQPSISLVHDHLSSTVTSTFTSTTENNTSEVLTTTAKTETNTTPLGQKIQLSFPSQSGVKVNSVSDNDSSESDNDGSVSDDEDPAPVNNNADQVPVNNNADQVPVNNNADQVPVNNNADQVPVNNNADPVPVNKEQKNPQAKPAPTGAQKPVKGDPLQKSNTSPETNVSAKPELTVEDNAPITNSNNQVDNKNPPVNLVIKSANYENPNSPNVISNTEPLFTVGNSEEPIIFTMKQVIRPVPMMKTLVTAANTAQRTLPPPLRPFTKPKHRTTASTNPSVKGNSAISSTKTKKTTPDKKLSSNLDPNSILFLLKENEILDVDTINLILECKQKMSEGKSAEVLTTLMKDAITIKLLERQIIQNDLNIKEADFNGTTPEDKSSLKIKKTGHETVKAQVELDQNQSKQQIRSDLKTATRDGKTFNEDAFERAVLIQIFSLGYFKYGMAASDLGIEGSEKKDFINLAQLFSDSLKKKEGDKTDDLRRKALTFLSIYLGTVNGVCKYGNESKEVEAIPEGKEVIRAKKEHYLLVKFLVENPLHTIHEKINGNSAIPSTSPAPVKSPAREITSQL